MCTRVARALASASCSDSRSSSIFAILEIDGHVNVPRHIRLPDIELFQESREEFSGRKIRWCGSLGALPRMPCHLPPHQTPAGLPRKIPAGPGPCPRACETDLPPACRLQSDTRTHRHHRLRHRRYAVSPATAPRWRSGPDTRRAFKLLCPGGLLPCVRAENATGRSAALRETTSCRAPLPDKSPASSIPQRTVPGSA